MKENQFLKSIKNFAILVLAGLSANYAFAQTRSISGTVVDNQNVPVIGASVIVVGNSTMGTVTDLDGRFSLNVPAGSSISVSFIGYETQVLPVGNQSVFNIVLKEDSEFLEETVVIGYGVQRKSDLTGAVASVKDTDLSNRSTTTVAQALQGKAAGVQIVNSSGAPGSNAQIQIRGYSSNTKTTPLMIVDGLKVSDINYLEPDNIESIEILKDAASAAIYGIEAGNGVILVTTKSGKSAGNGRVFYNFMSSTQTASNLPDLMRSKTYVEYQEYLGSGAKARWDGVSDTYWPDKMLEKGHTTRHTLGAQASNDRGSFYVSLTYLDDNGIVIGDKDTQKRLSGQVNAEFKINKWLTIGTNNTIEHSFTRSVSEAGSIQTTVLGAMLAHDPITPWTWTEEQLPSYVMPFYDGLPKDENGNYYGVSPFSTIYHPAIFLQASDGGSESFNIRGTTFANLTLFKGFVFTSRFGYRAGNSATRTFYPFWQTSTVDFQDMHLTQSASSNLFYQWENFANYNTNIGKHAINAMAGFSFQKSTSESLTGNAYTLTETLPNYRYMEYSVNDSKMSLRGLPGRSANMSFYGRLGWSYANKYMIQANFRADAYDTAKLDPSNRWGYFPSVSAGWTVSNEPWFAGVKDAVGLTFMKLRASWGINGNVNAMSNYQYDATLSANNNNGYNFIGDERTVGVGPGNVLPNPKIKWETSRQLDLGVDLRFFQERLTATIDWYNKNTNDLITSTTAPGNTGSSSMNINAGKVNNHGTEFELGWKDNIGDFSYGISANLATLHNMVVEGTSTTRVQGANIHSAEGVTYFEAGYPLWYLRLYEIDHIDQQTGEAVYVQRDDNPALNDEDRDYSGKGMPDFTYGATLNLGWKGFDLIVYGSGAQGVDRLYALTRADQVTNNTLTEFYTKAWPNPGYIHPKPTNLNYLLCSEDRMFDASFFKIKQIQLGYSFPTSLLRKISLSSLRLYVSMDDWFTFTKYPGLDPEISLYGSSASGLAVDGGSYPISKKLVFGLNVSF